MLSSKSYFNGFKIELANYIFLHRETRDWEELQGCIPLSASIVSIVLTLVFIGGLLAFVVLFIILIRLTAIVAAT
jgi:hypothetical protein